MKDSSADVGVRSVHFFFRASVHARLPRSSLRGVPAEDVCAAGDAAVGAATAPHSALQAELSDLQAELQAEPAGEEAVYVYSNSKLERILF